MHVHDFASRHLLLCYVAHLLLSLLSGDRVLPRNPRLRHTVCVYALSLNERILQLWGGAQDFTWVVKVGNLEVTVKSILDLVFSRPRLEVN